MIAAEALAGGFLDRVFDSQSVFRALLRAMARPGQVVALPTIVRPPAAILASAAAVVATLAEPATPVFLDAVLTEDRAVAEWITFHTGAPVVAVPEQAVFAVVGNATAMPPLDAFAQGTDTYPDRSTTIILQVEAISGGPEHMELTGPGIDGVARISPRPLASGFVSQMQANRGRFPRGVDLVLAAPDTIVGLPRATVVRTEVG